MHKQSKQKFFDELGNTQVDYIYASSDFGFVKPDKMIYKTLLRELKFQTSNCLFFDDVKKNVETANNLGIHAFIYENLEQMKRIIQSF